MTLTDFGDPVYALWFTGSQNSQKIIWLSSLSTLSVPDEGYSRNASVRKFLLQMHRNAHRSSS
jgi:hypothetical protein